MVPRPSPCATSSRTGIQKGYDAFWGGGNVDPESVVRSLQPLANAQAIADFLATLKPATDAQKAALATAQQYASMVEQSRLLMSLQVASGAGVVGSDRDPGLLDGGAVFRHRPLRRVEHRWSSPPSPSARCRSRSRSFSFSSSACPIPACSRCRPPRSSRQSSTSTSSHGPRALQPRRRPQPTRGVDLGGHRVDPFDKAS